jgi:hypothetical protein
MSEDIEGLISPDVLNINGVQVRKPSAGSLALCDFAKLKMLSGTGTEFPFFEALAFFYIHSQPLTEVRKLIFDKSLGHSDNGTSIAFFNAVIDWGDEVELGSVNDMGDMITSMLQEAMSPKVEAVESSASESQIKELVGEVEEKKIPESQGS